MPDISLVVMTYNEEHNIERCIDSAATVVEEILVVDSFSTDNTVALAEAKGARVIQHPFTGYKEQRAYTISQAKHDYVLVLDADEALDDRLRESIAKAKNNWTHECYHMNRMSNIEERWIKHGGWYPDRKMRLFHKEKYQTAGTNPHDKIVPQSGYPLGYLKGDILHYTNSSIEDRIATVNQFSSIAAQAFYEKGKRGNLARILFKPGLRFISEYLLQRGFLDGLFGLIIAKTSAQYVFYREIKLYLLNKKQK